MTKGNKGFVRGVIYPLIAFGVHTGLALLLKTGWLTDTGALAVTGFVGYVDHYIITNPKKKK